jgi:DNA-binding response OmpR family regulator
VGALLGTYYLKKPFDADQLVAAVQCLAISH